MKTPALFNNTHDLTHSTFSALLYSHIDNSIRLDVVHVGVPEAQLLAVPLGGANDASGDGVLEGEGAADCNHKLTRPQVCTVAQKQYRQFHLGRDKEQTKDKTKL